MQGWKSFDGGFHTSSSSIWSFPTEQCLGCSLQMKNHSFFCGSLLEYAVSLSSSSDVESPQETWGLKSTEENFMHRPSSLCLTSDLEQRRILFSSESVLVLLRNGDELNCCLDSQSTKGTKVFQCYLGCLALKTFFWSSVSSSVE